MTESHVVPRRSRSDLIVTIISTTLSTVLCSRVARESASQNRDHHALYLGLIFIGVYMRAMETPDAIKPVPEVNV